MKIRIDGVICNRNGRKDPNRGNSTRCIGNRERGEHAREENRRVRHTAIGDVRKHRPGGYRS